MSAVLKPLVQLDLQERIKPDAYESDGGLVTPAPDFVISREKSGEVLSRYGDQEWDLSPYRSSLKTPTRLLFNKIPDPILVGEAKRIIFLVMVLGKGRGGSALSTSSIITGYYHQAILPIAMFALARGSTISDVLSSGGLLKECADTFISNQNWLAPLSSLLGMLDRISNAQSGIAYKHDEEFLEYLRSKSRKERGWEKKQTEVIPTAILSESIRQRWEQISEMNALMPALMEFMRSIMESEYFGISIEKHKKLKGESDCLLWDEAVEALGLQRLFEKYGVKERRQFRRFVKQLQGTCKHLIHAYTGMRDMEAISLTTGCLESITRDERKIVRLIGTTTKLEGAHRKTKWITTKEIEKVVSLLAWISSLIAEHIGSELEEIPLFVSPKVISPASKGSRELKVGYQFQPKDQLPLDWSRLKVRKQDIDELKEIEIFRDWDSEERFQVGQPWHFKSHQYRRSLAVYALQSGLVSLGGLRIQLKHLFKEMTLYYGNGASSAKKIFEVGVNHIANDVNEIKPEIDALSYIKNVIVGDEKLYGAHGKFVESSVKSGLQESGILLNDRAATIEKFKRGEIAYKETALGGCVTIDPCESRLTGSITACISCDCGVHTKSKLDNVIRIQQEYIEALREDSIEYRSESADLRVLVEYRKQIEKEKS